MARKKYKLTQESIARFEQVLIDIKQGGYSCICPVILPLTNVRSCWVCNAAFPKNDRAVWCPCNKGYNKAYLIKRVRQIIKSGEM